MSKFTGITVNADGTFTITATKGSVQLTGEEIRRIYEVSQVHQHQNNPINNEKQTDIFEYL